MYTALESGKILLAVFFLTISQINVSGQTISFLSYTDRLVEETTVYEKGNDYQKDVLLFCNLIGDTHPAFAGKKESHPFDLEKVQEEAYEWAARCRSVEELHAYLQRILTRLHDSHTTLQPIMNTQLIYPFSIFREKDHVYLWAVDKQHEACLGKQIEKINGYPVNEVIDSFKDCISSENEVYFDDKVNGFMQLFASWNRGKYASADSVLSLTLSGGTETVRLKPVSLKNVSIVWKKEYQNTPFIRKNMKMPFDYQLLKDEGICYLQFNACMDRSSVQYQNLIGGIELSSQQRQALNMIPRFDSFLQVMFDSVRTNKIETLVVDIRGNRGGNSFLGDVLLSYLKPENEIRQGKTLIRFSDLWEQSYPTLAKEYHSMLSSSGEKVDRNKLYDTELPVFMNPDKSKAVADSIHVLFVKNRETNNVFKGKVLFLQDEKTFSSAGLLVTLARDNGIGMVVGSKSAYSPCSYGDLLAWELPHTKIKGFVSHKLFMRADDTKCGERSLLPDVWIPSTWQNVSTVRDAVWEWVLENHRTSVDKKEN